ncbi:hypothetical protein [uncultured Fusobacterium sp.]|uniref:hypothetical protein n=1 Tax=uncultured Fusobacterium sp. TaxID=159267 RepID=UPI002598656C|nr:hypothetical protein [uncultured Fusobacterium sp.]
MKYNGFTNAGSIYQAKCKANELPIKFVKVKVGNGLLEETEDPAKFIDIKSLKKEVGISEKTQIQDAVRLTIQLDNDGVNEGYFPREFGIYVEDEGVEVLYWYVNDGNEASYLPSQNTAPVKLKNHFNIIATSLESLIVNWDGKEFWVDKEYLGKELAKKEDKIEIKESAFNRPFGTLENEVLEGIQLARTLGLEYGGELNNSNIKTIDTVYYDTQNKSFFKCFQENSLNYADSNYYEGISNNDLLLKLQNLANSVKTFVSGNINLPITVEENWKFGLVTIRFKDSRGTSTTIPITYTSENFSTFEQVDSSGNIYHDLVNIVGNGQLNVYSAIKEKGISNILYISKAVLFY